MEASLSVLGEIGMAGVEAELLRRATRLAEAVLGEPALELLSPGQAERRSGIVSFRFKGRDAPFHAELYRQLMAHGIICAHRGGGIRYSPHFYTDEGIIDRALHTALALAASIA